MSIIPQASNLSLPKQTAYKPGGLPTLMILYLILLIVAGVTFTFIGQPVEYWVDYGRSTSDLPWVSWLLSVHPLFFLAAVVFYLAVLGLFLKKANRTTALVVWLVILLIHLRLTFFSFTEDWNRFFHGTCCIVSEVDSWLWRVFVVITGLVLALWLRRLDRQSAPEMSHPVGRGFWTAVSLPSVWLIALVVWLMATTTFNDVGWRPLVSENRPEAISSIKAVYDTNRQTAVLFGGEYWSAQLSDWVYVNETWEWDGVDWVQRFPAHQPSRRTKHAMAYDPIRGVVVLFGGHDTSGDLNDVWEWDGEDWVEKRPSFAPPIRCCHSLYFDPERGKTVAYGGLTGSYFYTDGWAWDGSEWEAIYFEGTAPQTSGHDLEYFPPAGYTLVLPNLTLQGNSWNTTQFDLAPEYRRHAEMAYIPETEQLILFGGLENEELYDDTWLLTADGWQQLDLPQSPPGRWGQAMFYDEVRGHVVLFGGTGNGGLNDMWELWLPNEE
ncbi:MAG: hypothetical protein IPM53_03350 [Anaerolineaceae bacterium]|nr:hypothetical protein [Anaerolineaceae bacterium]